VKEPVTNEDILNSEKMNLDIIRQTIDFSQPIFMIETLKANTKIRLHQIRIMK